MRARDRCFSGTGSSAGAGASSTISSSSWVAMRSSSDCDILLLCLYLLRFCDPAAGAVTQRGLRACTERSAAAMRAQRERSAGLSKRYSIHCKG